MLKSLSIKNLVLVEEAQIELSSGLTVITGETGSGKTVLIEALRLVMGERADSSKVRKGCDKALVVATFHPPETLAPLLDEAGIEHDLSEELILAREIHSNGKGRAFVNRQVVPSSLLKKLSPYLIDFIGQHAQVLLKSTEEQEELLDTFIGLDLAPFQTYYKAEKRAKKHLEELLTSKKEAQALQHRLEAQIEELNEAAPLEGEEETLFEEYTLLANAQELLAEATTLTQVTDESLEKSLILQKGLEKLSRFDKGLEEAGKMGKETHLFLGELSQLLQSFQAKVESDPNRLQFLEARLGLLDHLKKKYGKPAYDALQTFTAQLAAVGNLDEAIENAETSLEKARVLSNESASALRAARLKGAKTLSTLLSESLKELNIPNAEVAIAVDPAPRTMRGDDSAEFFLRANKGEESVPVRESSSGGELSRLLFSLKLLLASRQGVATMVFDEIDANVGGETATIIGKKLKALGSSHQILCITHFPQVARQGDQHLVVAKKEAAQRTTSLIKQLLPASREDELLRMLGGKEV